MISDKGPSSQGYGFSSGHVWMWELDYKKKAQRRRIEDFQLWCWRRLLRVLWTARRSNQSILKEISPGCSLEGLMLKLKLWPPDAKSWLIWKDPDGGKDWGQEENAWMASPTQWTWIWVNSGNWWWTGRPGVLWFMGSQRVEHDWVTELNWTDHLHLGPRHFTTPKGNFEPINNHPPLNLSSFPGNY